MVLTGHPRHLVLPHSLPKHMHSDAPASLLWFTPHFMHTPDTEYVPEPHTDAASPPSHPKPNGHAAHTRSPVASHFLTRSNPAPHISSHRLHLLAPLADHVPSPHSLLALFAHWKPGSHGQHVVQFGGSSPYSPGGHAVVRRH